MVSKLNVHSMLFGLNNVLEMLEKIVIYTLYCQKYWDTLPNHWIQVFQSLPWPQVFKIKHLGMQTASTNICERMGRSQEISEFMCGTVIGCHLCTKSIHEISSLLNIPRSTDSGIITKWKQLGTTHAEAHSAQKSPPFCRVNSYRPPNFVWPSD